MNASQTRRNFVGAAGVAAAAVTARQPARERRVDRRQRVLHHLVAARIEAAGGMWSALLSVAPELAAAARVSRALPRMRPRPERDR